MKLLTVTSDPLQTQVIVLPNGAGAKLTLGYKPLQQGWFINSLVYQSFALNGMRVTNQVNMLRQWKNIVPFGLGCFSTDNREPTLLLDFSGGASQLFLLDQSEVKFYEDFLNQG